MEKEINLYDIVTVKEDHIFEEPSGTMRCKKGMLGRVVEMNNSSKGFYYAVEFFDKSEILSPVFFFSKDQLELVGTEDEDMAKYLKKHPEYITDENWLKRYGVDMKKIRSIWDKEGK